VAPTTAQLAENPKAVILVIVTRGTVGGGGRVVRIVAKEYVGPVEFMAAITREYVVLANNPVKLADLLATPASVEGVTKFPSIEYVYEVALVPPVQVAVKEVSLKSVIVTTGAVGGKIKVVALTLVETADVLCILFNAVTNKEYDVSGKSPVKVAVLPDTLSVEGTVVTLFSLYVYEVAFVPPVQVAVNDVGLSEPILTTGVVGVIIVFG
jgi:hypothetical protein